MLGFIKGALSIGVQVFKLFTRSDQKPALTDVIPFVIEKLFPAVQQAIAYGELDTKEKIDAWLETFDASTGTDPGAVELIPNMPAEIEEAFFDKIKDALRIYAYCLIKVPGYTQ